MSLNKNNVKNSGNNKNDMNNLLTKNKKLLQSFEKIKQLEENMKNIPNTLGIEQIKSEIQGIKSGINNCCTINDFKDLTDKIDDLQKQIKFNKVQFEDYANDKSDHEEIQSTKKKLELSVNKTHELESVLIELIKKIDKNDSKSHEINQKTNRYLESRIFDEFKSQI